VNKYLTETTYRRKGLFWLMVLEVSSVMVERTWPNKITQVMMEEGAIKQGARARYSSLELSPNDVDPTFYFSSFPSNALYYEPIKG
jgi:hypothetical protein